MPPIPLQYSPQSRIHLFQRSSFFLETPLIVFRSQTIQHELPLNPHSGAFLFVLSTLEIVRGPVEPGGALK